MIAHCMVRHLAVYTLSLACRNNHAVNKTVHLHVLMYRWCSSVVQFFPVFLLQNPVLILTSQL
jgi:hypothetical protein